MVLATLLSVDMLWIAVIGLLAGLLGGMLGVGGSVIMIPGLTLALGYDQHLYQASAMLANVAVSVPAALRHHRAGAIVPAALWRVLPWALVTVLLGVAASNLAVFRGADGGLWLGRVLAGFIVYVIYVNLRRLLGDSDEEREAGSRPGLSVGRCALVGGAMGGSAGLLGIGGGALAVPLQHLCLGLKLRSAIATSSALICVTATVGAAYKLGTLGDHGSTWQQGVQTALLLAPTAWIGGRIGAGWTHRLPLRQVRGAFVVLMAVAVVKMAAVPWGAVWNWLGSLTAD